MPLMRTYSQQTQTSTTNFPLRSVMQLILQTTRISQHWQTNPDFQKYQPLPKHKKYLTLDYAITLNQNYRINHDQQAQSTPKSYSKTQITKKDSNKVYQHHPSTRPNQLRGKKRNKKTGFIFIDLEKAFDEVNREILFTSLWDKALQPHKTSYQDKALLNIELSSIKILYNLYYQTRIKYDDLIIQTNTEIF